MANVLTNKELKALWLQGVAYANNEVVGFDEMVKAYKRGNDITISTGDNDIIVKALLLLWLSVSLIIGAPALIFGAHKALTIAGF